MARLPIGKFLATTGIGWSIMTLLMATPHNAGGLMAVRFLMGIMEAPGFPSVTLITSMWYSKREQPIRIALWSSTFASVRLQLDRMAYELN